MLKSMPAVGRALLVLGTVAALAVPGAAWAQDNEFAEPLTALANGQLREIAQNPVVVAAIEAQNATTSAYDDAKVTELDTQWRAEVSASTKPLIDATLANDASKYLAQMQGDSAGVFTEIFVM